MPPYVYTHQRERVVVVLCSSARRLFEPQCQSNTALLSRRPSPHMACPSMACAPMPHPPKTEGRKGRIPNQRNNQTPVLRARDCVCVPRCLIKRKRNHCGGPTTPILRTHDRKTLSVTNICTQCIHTAPRPPLHAKWCKHHARTDDTQQCALLQQPKCVGMLIPVSRSPCQHIIQGGLGH